MTVFAQLAHKSGAILWIADQIDVMPSSGKRHIEQSSLFGERKPFLLGQQHVKEWRSWLLRRKTKFPPFHAQHNDVVGLLTFRSMHGHGLNLQSRKRPSQLIQIVWHLET